MIGDKNTGFLELDGEEFFGKQEKVEKDGDSFFRFKVKQPKNKRNKAFKSDEPFELKDTPPSLL